MVAYAQKKKEKRFSGQQFLQEGKREKRPEEKDGQKDSARFDLRLLSLPFLFWTLWVYSDAFSVEREKQFGERIQNA